MRPWLPLAGVVALGLTLRANRLLLGFPLFGDEAFLATSVLERDLAGLRGHLDYDMVAPLGYLAIARGAVSAFDPREWVLRLPAFLAGCAALLVLARFAWRRLERWPALLATAALAAAYYAMRHTCEAKPYALDLLAGAALLAAWTPARDEDEPPCPRAARVGLAALLVWLSYPAAFAAGGVLLARALARDGRGRARRLTELCLDGAVVAASFSAMYLLHAQGQQWGASDLSGHASQWADDFLPLGQPLEVLPWLVRQHTGLMLALPAGGSGFGSAGTLLLVLVGLFVSRGGPWPTLRRQLLGVAGLQLLASALQLYPYGGSARASLQLFPWFALFLGAGLARVLGPRGRPVGLALLVLLMLWLGVRDHLQPYKEPADRALRAEVRALAEDLEPGEEVLLFGRLGAGAGSGPDLLAWRSGSARLRCYVRIETGRSPGTTAGSALLDAAATTVLAFEDPRTAPFPGDELDGLVTELRDAGAEVTRRVVDLGEGQRLTVLRIGV